MDNIQEMTNNEQNTQEDKKIVLERKTIYRVIEIISLIGLFICIWFTGYFSGKAIMGLEIIQDFHPIFSKVISLLIK